MNSLTFHPTSSNGPTVIGQPPQMSSPATASILIADQDNFARAGLRLLLQKQPAWKVVAETTVESEAAARVIELEPDLVVAAISARYAEGFRFVKSLHEEIPATRVLLLADQGQSVIERAFAAGVLGYVPKQHADSELIPAVQALLEGRIFFSALAVQQLRAHYRQLSAKVPILSSREMGIVQFLCDGKTNKEIASALGLSVRTVDNHRANIMLKLKIKTFAELVRYCIREGIVDPLWQSA